MSEEQEMAPEAIEETNDVSSETGTKIQDVEVLQKELDRARREAAKSRVDAKEFKRLEEDAKKWQEHLDSQKTELDKLKDAKKELEKKLKDTESQRLRAIIANEYKLDEELMEFVTGSDEDEMRTKAEKLAARAAKSGSADLYAGSRGTPVVAKRNVGADFLLDLAKDF